MITQNHRLFAALIEWRAARPKLAGSEKREFARWLLRIHPEIAAEFKGEPAQFRLTCRELQRGSALPNTRGIGEATLRRYAPALVRKYLSLQQRGTFLDFLNGVLERCQTEVALRLYLAERGGEKESTRR